VGAISGGHRRRASDVTAIDRAVAHFQDEAHVARPVLNPRLTVRCTGALMQF